MRRSVMAVVVAAGTVLALAQSACSAPDFASDHGGGPAGVQQPGPVFRDYGVNPEVDTATEHRSTFALDVDTGSYTLARAALREGRLPDPAAVRTEEFVNYFDQDYPAPPDGIGIHLDGTPVPFGRPGTRVLRVGLQAAVVEQAQRPPANLTFIIDVSGSMEGHNLEMVRSGLNRLLDSLRDTDAVAIATFDTEAALVLEMTPVSAREEIRAAIEALAPGGSTNLEAGLQVGYAHAGAQLRPDGINRVILLSDGEANVGQTDPGALAEQIARSAGQTTLAVIGVGRQTYNDVILEQFADQGNGFYAYIDTIREAERLFVHDLTGTLQLVARDARVQVSFNPEAVSRFRLLGYENRLLDHDDFTDDTVDAGEVGAGHHVTALYEVSLADHLPGNTVLATVEVRWRDPDHGEPVQRQAVITAGGLAGSLAATGPRLRQSILVAAFAEALREAPWGEQMSLAGIAAEVAALSRLLPADQRLAEFAELAETAARLRA